MPKRSVALVAKEVAWTALRKSRRYASHLGIDAAGSNQNVRAAAVVEVDDTCAEAHETGLRFRPDSGVTSSKLPLPSLR